MVSSIGQQRNEISSLIHTYCVELYFKFFSIKFRIRQIHFDTVILSPIIRNFWCF